MMKYCYPIIVTAMCSLLLSACLGGGNKPSTKYYLIEPVTNDSLEKTDAPLKLEIIDLQLPQYLERFHIAKRTDSNQITFSSNHQWGENLRKNLLRTLSRNLSVLLDTADVGTPLSRSASQADYRIQVFIEKFELDADGIVRLIARWQLSSEDKTFAMQFLSTASQAAIEDTDYSSMVTAMSELFAQLSGAVADSINGHQR